MGVLRCGKCGQARVRRCHREGLLERVLSGVYVYPYRCQLCAHRFRALRWGRRYARQPLDRREYERVAVRAPLVVVDAGARAEGEVAELSLQGCTARMRARLRDGATVRLELLLEPGEPAVVVAQALVRSVRADTAGLYFIAVSTDEQLRLRRVLTALYHARHAEGVPPAPPIHPDGPLRYLRSPAFWLTGFVLVLAAFVLTVLVPWFSRCVWGVSC